MTKRIEDLTDEEIASMTPEQFAALDGAETVIPNGADEGNDDDDDSINNGTQNDPNAEEAAKAAQEAEAAAAQAAVNDDPNGDDDEDKAKAEAEAAANGAEAGQGGDGKADSAGNAEDPTKTDVSKGAKDAKGKPADAKPADPTSATASDGDLKSFHAAITAPFKANGRDIQVKSAEEVRQLMQMGANYNKKMQAMKPHLATLRTLENAGIGEAELSFLIDLHKRDSGAINKLVKEAGIDPMDLTAEKADGYSPKNHKASDAEVELDAVLAELDGSEGLPKTLDVVSKQWDKASKRVVGENPQLLKVINAHVEAGIYDQIAAEVDRRRMLGQLTGLSDLEAYRQVGDAMNESGQFAPKGEKAGQPSNPGQQAPAAQVIVNSDPKKADDSKRKEAKRAVAPVKGAAPAAKIDPDFNPLSMSDEEFAKKFGGKF